MSRLLKSPFVALVLFSLVIALPTVIWIYPDSEDLHTTLFSTFQFADAFLHGRYPLWNTMLGFGSPLPFANSLVPHPLFLFFSPYDLRFALFLFTWIQLSVGTIFIFLICRRLGAGTFPSLIGAVTFALSSPTIYTVYIKVLPIYVFAWTLLPPILLMILYLADERSWRPFTVFKVIALGMLTGVLLLSGHVGTTSGFALPIALVAGLIAVRNPKALQFFVVSAAIGLLIVADKTYLIWSELQYSIAAVPDQKRVLSEVDFGYFSWWSAFLKPLVPAISPVDFILRNVRFGTSSDPIGTKLLFIGPPYALLVIAGFFVRFRSTRLYWPLVGGLVFSLVMLLAPQELMATLMVASGNLAFVAPLVLFAIVLATLALDEVARRLRGRGDVFVQSVALFQIACLVLGTLPYTIAGVKLKLAIGHVEILDRAMPLADYLKSIRKSPSSRIYLSPEVEKRGPPYIADWGGSANNALAILGMAQVQGYFKPTSTERFQSDENFGASEIHARTDVLENKPLLDVLGVEFVLAAEGESWSAGLRPVPDFNRRFDLTTRDGKRMVLLENPDVLPQVMGLTVPPAEISLPVRRACGDTKLLCRDYSSLRAHVIPAAVTQTAFPVNGPIAFSVAPHKQAMTVLVTQAYRPGWRAETASGQTLAVSEAFGGFIAIEVPPGVAKVSLTYAPPLRIALIVLQWLLLVCGAVALAGMATRRQVREAIRREFGQVAAELGWTGKFGLRDALRVPGIRLAMTAWAAVLVVGYLGAYVGYRLALKFFHQVIPAECIFYGLFVPLLVIALWRLWRRIPAGD